MTELAPLGRNCEGGNPLMSRDMKEFRNLRGEAAAAVQKANQRGFCREVPISTPQPEMLLCTKERNHKDQSRNK